MKPLTGCGTALVTPFQSDGTIDESKLRALVEWQLDEGVHFLVPCGSTGEAQTLTRLEHCQVVEVVAEVTAGRVPIVAGAGSNDTRAAIALSHQVRDSGASHLLHVSPWYSKPPQRGIVKHFEEIAAAVDLPIVAYNVPSRTASNISVETALQLAAIPNVVALKEASGDVTQIGEIIRQRPTGFIVLSGDDSLTASMMKMGGEGVISVVSNASPRQMVELVEAGFANDTSRLETLQEQLADWMSIAFVESNPIPVKAALAMLGRIENVLRLPLVPLATEHEAAVRHALQRAGVNLR